MTTGISHDAQFSRIRRDSKRLLVDAKAAMVVTVVIGTDGVLSECSSVLPDSATARISEAVTRAAKDMVGTLARERKD